MFFLCPAVLRKDLTYKRQQEQIGLSATLNSTVLQHTAHCHTRKEQKMTESVKDYQIYTFKRKHCNPTETVCEN